MNFYVMHSLEHMTLVKLATTLCSQNDVKCILRYFHRFISSLQKENMEDVMMAKLNILLLPEILKMKIMDLVLPIALQIREWEMCMLSFQYVKRVENKDNYFSIRDSIFLSRLCWTSQGTIDEKETAKLMILDENLDIAYRYILACAFCLEHDIPILWHRIPDKKQFYVDENVQEIDLVDFWTCIVTGDTSKLNAAMSRLLYHCTIYQYAFHSAAYYGNKVAIKYFFQKLTPDERNESLQRCAGFIVHKSYNHCRNHYTQSLHFILSQMNEKQLMNVLKVHPIHILKNLLNWPWQDFFLPVAHRVLNFLPKGHYEDLLLRIIHKTTIGYRNFSYQKLFQDFWRMIPSDHKLHLIHMLRSEGYLIACMFDAVDVESISLMLKDATNEDREAILFSNDGKLLCRNLSYGRKWDLLEFLFKQCLPSMESVAKFKEDFELYMHCTPLKALERDIWDQLYQILDDVAKTFDKKRSCEDKVNIPTKKLRI